MATDDDNIHLHAAKKSLLLLKRMTDSKVMGAAIFELRQLQSIASRNIDVVSHLLCNICSVHFFAAHIFIIFDSISFISSSRNIIMTLDGNGSADHSLRSLDHTKIS